jgi:hypothetical protein
VCRDFDGLFDYSGDTQGCGREGRHEEKTSHYGDTEAQRVNKLVDLGFPRWTDCMPKDLAHESVRATPAQVSKRTWGVKVEFLPGL